jgi:inner membrane protein
VDNVTHALAGLLLAEAAVQARAERAAPGLSFRTAAYVTSIWANNAPDLDFVYSGITERPFGYLLHHRGHSHTLPVALAIALATMAVITAVARRNHRDWSRGDLVALFALAGVGPLVHIAMDFSNNYGVHPFWPVYAGWFYGDAVFIVEPLFWAVGFPALVFAARTSAGRFALAAILALGVAGCWLIAFARPESRVVSFPAAAAVTLVAAIATLVAWRLGPRARIATAIGGSLAIATALFGASSAARAAVRRAVPPGPTIHDLVITPMPANPLCASALVVATEKSDYVVLRATVAILPSWYATDRCPTAAEGDPTAPLRPIAAPSTRAVQWKGEFRAPLRELTELARTNCQAAALFKFARAPYWVDTGTGELVVGDLRYDRRRGLDFSDAQIAARPARCPAAVPPWIPPRRDLLQSAGLADRDQMRPAESTVAMPVSSAASK